MRTIEDGKLLYIVDNNWRHIGTVPNIKFSGMQFKEMWGKLIALENGKIVGQIPLPKKALKIKNGLVSILERAVDDKGPSKIKLLLSTPYSRAYCVALWNQFITRTEGIKITEKGKQYLEQAVRNNDPSDWDQWKWG